VSVYDKLKALQISLKQVSAPAAAYVPYVRTGNLLFLSGHIARKDGKPHRQAWRESTTERQEGRPRAPSPSI
jgi:enamine deaminase RidA (YjgF/YER057c/UK114 family)